MSVVQQRKQRRWGETYVADEETLRNDYAGQYVQTGARPQNHLRNTSVETRFAEYPKLAALLDHKHALTASPLHSIPPTYLNLSSSSSSEPPSASTPEETPPSPMSLALSETLTSTSTSTSTPSPTRFDSILLTPPPSTTYEELKSLDLGRVAANPGFVWLWVGSGQPALSLGDGTSRGQDGIGLEKGRELLSLWGYRRCEDIVWLKTNKRDPEADLVRESTSLFTPTIEHCLMGIRGTVRRSTDSFLVHCNVDTDVLIWEGDSQDPDLKPPELQSLIENFCLGTRRLHLYGSPHSLRRGWLTLSSPSPSSKPTFSPESVVHPVEREGTAQEQRERWGAPREWTRDEWEARWRKKRVPVSMIGGGGGGSQQQGGGAPDVQRVDTLLPYVEELDALRPKSPPPRDGVPSSGGLGRGRGAGLGVTRSGLVTQGAAITSNSVYLSSSPNVTTNGNGVGRGRGRGRGRGGGRNHYHHNGMTNGMIRDEVLLTPGPMRHDIIPPRMPVTRPPPPPMGMAYPAPAPFPMPQQFGQIGPPPTPNCSQPQNRYNHQQQYAPPPPLPPMPDQGQYPQHFLYPHQHYSSPSPYGHYLSPQPMFAPAPQQQQQQAVPYGSHYYLPFHPSVGVAEHHHLSSGIGSLSLSPAAPPAPSSANGSSTGGEIVYPISSRSSTRSRVPSSAASTNGGAGTPAPYEDAPLGA